MTCALLERTCVVRPLSLQALADIAVVLGPCAGHSEMHGDGLPTGVRPIDTLALVHQTDDVCQGIRQRNQLEGLIFGWNSIVS
jgi:hypothetical protein